MSSPRQFEATITPKFRVELQAAMPTMEMAQVLGKSDWVDWVVRTLLMPSNDGRKIKFSIPSEGLDYKPVDGVSSEEVLLGYLKYLKEQHFTLFISGVSQTGFRGFPFLWNALPSWNRGKTNNWLFPLTLANFIYTYIASCVGYIIKKWADLAALPVGLTIYFTRLLFGYLFSSAEEKKQFMKADPRNQGKLIATAFIPLGLLLSPLWLIAQVLYLLANILDYTRQLFDGFTNLIVWGVGYLFGDQTKYPNPLISLEAIIKNALILVPIALLIIFSLVPGVGQAGFFVTNTLLNVSLVSLNGFTNFLIMMGLNLGYQLFGATVNSKIEYFTSAPAKSQSFKSSAVGGGTYTVVAESLPTTVVNAAPAQEREPLLDGGDSKRTASPPVLHAAPTSPASSGVFAGVVTPGAAGVTTSDIDYSHPTLQ